MLELINSLENAYGDNWNYLEVEAQASSFLEQLTYFYSEDELTDLYNLCK